MNYTSKKNGAEVELVITVSPDEYAPHLMRAAERISDRAAVKGFRKGHVPFEVVKKEFGEMSILQEALETIVKDTFYDAVIKEKLETIGMPKIEVEKVAPGNDVVYKATVALLPAVTLPNIGKIKVTKKVKEVGDKQIDETLNAIRGMRAKEVPKTDSATGTDKLVIDMDMLIDNVPIEGGQAKDYQVYLSEDHYIPGFNKQLEGAKKGERKEFQLEFPKEHYQKMLAGKKVDFKINVKDVFERQLPELSDDLAKTLGQNSVEELKKLIHNNLLEEAAHKADEQAEVEILDALIQASTFDAIPQVIIDAEKQKMFYELKRDLDRNGVSIEQYLNDIKKTQDEIFKDFQTQAEKRAKAALISRQVAKDQSLAPSDEEIQKELEFLRETYKDNKEYLDNLKRPEVRDSVATMLQNKKVMHWLKEQVLGPEEKK